MASSETQAIMDETIAVLVVDDDASIQSIVEETLQRWGLRPDGRLVGRGGNSSAER